MIWFASCRYEVVSVKYIHATIVVYLRVCQHCGNLLRHGKELESEIWIWERGESKDRNLGVTSV